MLNNYIKIDLGGDFYAHRRKSSGGTATSCY